MADQKITDLTALTAPTTGDVLPIVHDPAGTPVTEKISVDTLSTILSVGSLARQAIMNGNFDIWQRAVTSTNPADAAFVADRWQVSRDADSGSFPTNTIHSRQALTPGDVLSAFYYYRINPDGAGSSFGTNAQYVIRQKIEHGTRFLAGLGKKVTVSFYARSSIGSKKLGIGMVQSYGSGGSPSANEALTGTSITLTSSWVKYTFTFTTNTIVGKTFGTGNNDYLMLILGEVWGTTFGSTYFGGAAAESFVGSGTIDIAQVQICAGDIALPFQPKTFEDELRISQRYYEKSYSYGEPAGTATASGAEICLTAGGACTIGDLVVYGIKFRTEKRTTPTIVIRDRPGTSGKCTLIHNNSSETDNITANVNSEGTSGAQFFATTTATTNRGFKFHWTADAEM